MSELKTAAQMRGFLLETMQKVSAGAMGTSEAATVAKLAAQVNQSLITEVSAKLRLKELGEPADGDLLLAAGAAAPEQAVALPAPAAEPVENVVIVTEPAKAPEPAPVVDEALPWACDPEPQPVALPPEPEPVKVKRAPSPPKVVLANPRPAAQDVGEVVAGTGKPAPAPQPAPAVRKLTANDKGFCSQCERRVNAEKAKGCPSVFCKAKDLFE